MKQGYVVSMNVDIIIPFKLAKDKEEAIDVANDYIEEITSKDDIEGVFLAAVSVDDEVQTF